MSRVFTAMALSAVCAHSAVAASITEVKSLVKGVYELEEWRVGDKVLKPPQVDGRFVLRDGTVITILMKPAGRGPPCSAPMS
jgi:hypothetical protein